MTGDPMIDKIADTVNDMVTNGTDAADLCVRQISEGVNQYRERNPDAEQITMSMPAWAAVEILGNEPALLRLLELGITIMIPQEFHFGFSSATDPWGEACKKMVAAVESARRRHGELKPIRAKHRRDRDVMWSRVIDELATAASGTRTKFTTVYF